MRLQETLDEIRAGASTRIPAEARQIMARATEELERSGLVAQAVGVDDQAPEFELEDYSGNLVTSRDLLVKGPVVLTFFRGPW